MTPIVDLHVHLIHDIDDGARSLEDSLALARALFEAGTQVCALTPHYNPPVHTLEGFEERVSELREALVREETPLRLVEGAEVALHMDIQRDFENGTVRALGSTRTVLLEMPTIPPPPRFRDFIFDVASRRYTPVLAHPERCSAFAGDPDRLASLRESGARVQITAGALLGSMGRALRKVTRTFLRRGMVDVIASDAHGWCGRPVDLIAAATEAQRWCGSADAAQAMVSSTPAALLGLREPGLDGAGDGR